MAGRPDTSRTARAGCADIEEAVVLRDRWHMATVDDEDASAASAAQSAAGADAAHRHMRIEEGAGRASFAGRRPRTAMGYVRGAEGSRS